MTAPDVIAIVALVASIIEEVRAEGKAVVYYVTGLICIAILWHLFPWT